MQRQGRVPRLEGRTPHNRQRNPRNRAALTAHRHPIRVSPRVAQTAPTAVCAAANSVAQSPAGTYSNEAPSRSSRSRFPVLVSVPPHPAPGGSAQTGHRRDRSGLLAHWFDCAAPTVTRCRRLIKRPASSNSSFLDLLPPTRQLSDHQLLDPTPSAQLPEILGSGCNWGFARQQRSGWPKRGQHGTRFGRGFGARSHLRPSHIVHLPA